MAVKLTTQFKELPEPVKTWLASTQITYIISDLNRRLGFSEEEKMRVVPTLILRLAISSVNPENFVYELSKLLDISPSAAKALAQEIEEKMLRPIELVLRNELGIDIKLIHFAKEAAEQPATVLPTQTKQELISTQEAAHPYEQPANPIPLQQRTAPTPPPIPPTVARPSYSEPPKEMPVPFKVGKIPTWGPPPQEPKI